MKTISEMREEIKVLVEALGKMKAQCAAENRSPNDDERMAAAAKLDKIDEWEAQVALAERIENTEERLSKPKTKPVKPDVETNSVSAAERKRKDQFLTLGEQLQAVIRASHPAHRTVDPRLRETRAISGMSEAVQSDGGFLVQEDFSTELLKNVFETGKLASRIRRVSLSGPANSIKINGIDESSRANGSRWGGIQMYWEEEAAEKTKSKPKFRQIRLELKKLIGLCYATDELLEDSAALEAVISQAFQNEMGFKIDDGILNGTGAGQLLGIRNQPATIQQTKETGQDAATVVYENIVKMWSRLLPDAQMNSVWLINQDVFPQLATMGLAVGTGGSAVYLPPGGASVSPYASLMGRPIIPMEQCQTLGTNGDIMLGDFGNGYIFVDKGGLKQDMSIHVRFQYDESCFRFVYRCDGQPVLAKAITPFKGSNTLGHFVKLQTRS